MNTKEIIKEDMSVTLENINKKIKVIDSELENIDSVVQVQIKNIFDEYKKELPQNDTKTISLDDFIAKNLDLLKQKKVEFLEKAKSKLENLRKEVNQIIRVVMLK